MAIYTNASAKLFSFDQVADVHLIQDFHRRLPGFTQTPLISLDDLTEELGVKKLFVKDESSRLGLPAFKILGASWGTFRAIAQMVSLSLDANLSDVSKAAVSHGVKLFAATDGNHGRAVAWMASLLGIEAYIYVPDFVDAETQRRIASEGAHIEVVPGDYDTTVAEATRHANHTQGGLLVQDTSFEGYEDIPGWIVDGYSTMLIEIEEQLQEQGLKASIVVTPVGVGSLATAVVAFCKSKDRAISVLAVEPTTAACLHESLRAGQPTTIQTSPTICDGMNCGSVSPVAWPILRIGVNASVTVTDTETHAAVQTLLSRGVDAGPCGAATLAGLKRVSLQDSASVGLSEDSVVVLLCTEGHRPYPAPG